MFRSLATTALRRGGVFTIEKSVANKVNNFSGLRVAFFSTEDASGPAKGTVKWFDVKKGFGFLVPEDNSGDIFVHQTAIHAEGFRSLMDGEPVEFEVIEDDTGRKSAQNVTGPDGAYVQGRPRPQYNDYGGGGFAGRNDGGFGGGGFAGGNDGGFGGGQNY
mmetsp:Transcript_6389/g.9038  ORF Transcript_6389/g.9038 Transcript_6389/m.9038 type:complete len:161 (+) Transcript_6389:89-571(+)